MKYPREEKRYEKSDAARRQEKSKTNRLADEGGLRGITRVVVMRVVLRGHHHLAFRILHVVGTDVHLCKNIHKAV